MGVAGVARKTVGMPPSLCCVRWVSDMSEASSSAGEPSRKDGRKGKESRKHRQNASVMSSGTDPVAAYSITLDYSGRDGKGSSRKDDSKSASHRKR